MLMCETAEEWIVREADGLLSQGERDRLDEHGAECVACRELREANLAVKAVLARREDAVAPAAFAAQVAARTAPASPVRSLAGIDWRLWTEWMLPVAAGLVLAAVLVGGAASPGTTAETQDDGVAAQAAVAGDDRETTVVQALGDDATTEELLAAMLGTAAGGTEGAGDGR